MQIVDIYPDNSQLIQQVADLLFVSFQENYPHAWPNIEAALKEVEESLAEDRISRVAIAEENGMVLGWIGGIKQYNGFVWELHPLAVKAEFRRRGIGRSLVADLEKEVKKRGGITLWVGTDDENNQTSLSQKNLYPNLWEHVKNIKNWRGHPYAFYQKIGFVIVGVMPDANGLGKPDIYMAKRIT